MIYHVDLASSDPPFWGLLDLNRQANKLDCKNITQYTELKVKFLGFDEYMNLVLDEAVEVHLKRHTRKPLSRIMLKGDNITLIQAKDAAAK